MPRIPGLLCYRIINNPRANSGSSVLLVDLDPSFTDYAVSDPSTGWSQPGLISYSSTQ